MEDELQGAGGDKRGDRKPVGLSSGSPRLVSFRAVTVKWRKVDTSLFWRQDEEVRKIEKVELS